MPSTPVRFTDDQQKLFQRVAEVVKSDPEAFKEAGEWLDAGADMPDAMRRAKQARDVLLREADKRQRRECKKAGRQYIARPRDPEVDRWYAKMHRQASKLTSYEIIDAAVEGFGFYRGLVGEPPDYDALRPDLAERQARRVLLVAWILSDARPLATSPPITKLQGWEWGVADFSDDPIVFKRNKKKKEVVDHSAPRRINRLYARTTLLDDHLDQWAILADDALRHLKQSHGGREQTEPDDKQPTHDLGPGEWLMPPMSLAEMGARVGNSERRKIKTLLEPHDLRKYPASNRQSWTVRLDAMPQTLRHQLTTRR